MSWLQNKIVTFRLSTLGARELQDVFPETSFPAVIADVNETGAWLIFDDLGDGKSAPSFLLKWEYVATASVELALENEEPKPSARQIGFRR